MPPIHLSPGQRVLVKRLLDSSTLEKWFEVIPQPTNARAVGNVGVVIQVFKPQYYTADCNWIVEVYQYDDKQTTFYIPEELVALVVTPALRRAGMKDRKIK